MIGLGALLPAAAAGAFLPKKQAQYTTGRDAKGNWYVYGNGGMQYYGNDTNAFNAAKGRLSSAGQAEVWEGDMFGSGAGVAGGALGALGNNGNGSGNWNGTGTGSGSGGGGGGGGSANVESAAERQARIQRENSLKLYRQMLDALGGQEKADIDRTNREFDMSVASLTKERDNAYANLDREQGKLDKQKSKSLNQLGTDIRNLMNSTNTQLGMYGAGNSSAVGMAARGVSDLANSTSADIADQYNEQSGDIASNRAQLGTKYENEYDKLGMNRANSIAEIKQQYRNQANDLNQKIINNTIDNGEAERSLNDMKNRLSQNINPSYEFDKQNLGAYKASGINRADVAGTVAGPALTTEQAMQYFNPNSKRKEQETSYY